MHRKNNTLYTATQLFNQAARIACLRLKKCFKFGESYNHGRVNNSRVA